ncbi:MAG: hypothetical protein ACUVSW_08075, partial [Roseiflexus sp.]
AAPSWCDHMPATCLARRAKVESIHPEIEPGPRRAGIGHAWCLAEIIWRQFAAGLRHLAGQ